MEQVASVPPNVICQICQDSLCSDDNEVTAPTCGHVFHMECLRSWLKTPNGNATGCPNCYQKIKLSGCRKLYLSVDQEDNSGWRQKLRQLEELQMRVATAESKLSAAEHLIFKLREELLEKDKEIMKWKQVNLEVTKQVTATGPKSKEHLITPMVNLGERVKATVPKAPSKGNVRAPLPYKLVYLDKKIVPKSQATTRSATIASKNLFATSTTEARVSNLAALGMEGRSRGRPPVVRPAVKTTSATTVARKPRDDNAVNASGVGRGTRGHAAKASATATQAAGRAKRPVGRPSRFLS